MPASPSPIPALLSTQGRISSTVRVRPIEGADVEAAARIAFDAFAGIADRHGFPRDFPTLDDALGLVTAFTQHPSIWGVVAESGGRVVGSNFLDERADVRGVGPITVDPAAQASGVGRMLMASVLDRARTAESVRLLQDTFNMGSLALYASLGFEVAEPVALVSGVPRGTTPKGVDVRPLVADDLGACRRLCLSVHRFDRTAELRDALEAPGTTPVVAHRGRRLVAYATTLADFGLAYAVGETEDDLFALIAGAVTPDGPPASFLLPLGQPALVRQCLAAGLRFVKPMTYMVAGPYRRPRGAWIPSVLS
jgi:predicted N-acetyltransferase YhbS